MGGFIISLFLELSVVWYYLCLHTEGKTQQKEGMDSSGMGETD